MPPDSDIGLFLQYQYDLSRMRLATIVSAAEVHSELKWHVESVVFPSFVSLASAKVVNGVPRRLDEVHDLLYPWFACVAAFGRDTGR